MTFLAKQIVYAIKALKSNKVPVGENQFADSLKAEPTYIVCGLTVPYNQTSLKDKQNTQKESSDTV